MNSSDPAISLNFSNNPGVFLSIFRSFGSIDKRESLEGTLFIEILVFGLFFSNQSNGCFSLLVKLFNDFFNNDGLDKDDEGSFIYILDLNDKWLGFLGITDKIC